MRPILKDLLKCRLNAQEIWAHLGKVDRKNKDVGLVIQVNRFVRYILLTEVATKRQELLIIFSKVEHPGFTSTGSAPTGNDVALLRLQQGVDLTNSPNINSICWPTRAAPVGLQVTASGWGLEWQHLGLFGTSKVLKKVPIKL